MSAERAPAAGPELFPGEDARVILDAEAVTRALRRMALEILEQNGPAALDTLALVGIHTRGVEVARRLAAEIERLEGRQPALGTVDVSMHRDDLRRRARLTSLRPTDLPFDLDARTVILADDVFFTGRTVRAALDALAEFGRPPQIQLAALVDRGHRELPIRPDYVGKEVATQLSERVLVRFQEYDHEPDAVWLVPDERDAG